MRIILLTLIGLLTNLSVAQSIWQRAELPLSTLRSDDAMYIPQKYVALQLNYNEAKSKLDKAVRASFTSDQHINFELPLPTGEMVTFHTYESPVMADGLAAKYPSIKTYKGISVDRTMIARFGYGPSGLHATIRTLEGEVYVDQVAKSGGQYYVSYYTRHHGEPRDASITFCGTVDAEPSDEIREPIGIANRSMGVDLHTYKLALACTGVWGARRGTKERALEDMVTSVNRLNQIYENEAGFRLELIDNNDRIIQIDPNNDGYTNVDQGRSLISQNTGRINTILGGSGGYDLGHIYTNRCTDVGGVAALGSMCQGNKGAGVTCHYTNLLYITVQVAAHEVGHQLSARHTFNNCNNDGNESFGNDMEPGSGSTIMSYGGLCGGNNVQGNNDDYYNNASLVEIYRHTREGGAFDCATATPTSNIAPVANIPLEDDFYIPISTSFVLTGEATDDNGDVLTYSWEQANPGNNACAFGDPTGNCPLFRSLPAKDVPYRFFPREGRIFSGSSDDSEILPTYERELKFAFTVRDNNPEAGFADWKYVEFNADATAGPFRVLTPGISEVYEVGQEMEVTWDVANTDNEKVNCQQVDIFLSIDRALHESDPNLIPLATNVTNTGVTTVILPNIEPTTTARILIKASNNIFFDISNFNFTIEEASSPRPYFSMDKFRDNICLPNNTVVNITTEALAGYTGNVRFEAVDLPQGVTPSFPQQSIAVGESMDVTFEISTDLPTGTYEWGISAISDNSDTITRKYFIDVISTDFSDLVNVSPDDGLKNDPGLPVFRWSQSFNATGYVFELSTSPTFDESSLVYKEELLDTFFITPDFLEKRTVYYWRVKGLNDCGEGQATFPRAFGTVNLDCSTYSATDLPINISASGSREIMSRINIPSNGSITDINIKNINLTHDRFKDLTATLKSPQGTEVVLWSSACARRYTMDIAFDDDSQRFFDCANGVDIFRPQGKLADFNDENPNGVWELVVADGFNSNGGRLDNMTIEICGSVDAIAPVLVTNETLQIQPGNKPLIKPSYLLTEDEDNSASELVYTLVTAPSHGNLIRISTALQVGDQFTQSDLNNGLVGYHNEEDADMDGFHFVVEDGDGGWIEITRFNIEIDESFPSSVNDLSLAQEVEIAPNPASGFFNVTIGEKASSLHTLQVLDITGRLILQQNINEGLNRVNIDQVQNGMYLVQLTNGRDHVIKRIILSNY